MSGSYLIVQTSKSLSVNAAAMTLGEGHRNVIQYIFPTYTVFVSIIWSLMQMVWHENQKSLGQWQQQRMGMRTQMQNELKT